MDSEYELNECEIIDDNCSEVSDVDSNYDEKYDCGKIYKIVCNETGLVYYGSTRQTMKKRINKHLQDFKINKGISSSEILKNNNYYVEVIEYPPCKNRFELELCEAYYIKNNECVNKRIARLTEEERKENIQKYREENKEDILAEKKIYYIENAEKIKSQRKNEYLEKTEIMKLRVKKYREENKEKIKLLSKKYCEENKEKISQKNKERYLRKKLENQQQQK